MTRRALLPSHDYKMKSDKINYQKFKHTFIIYCVNNFVQKEKNFVRNPSFKEKTINHFILNSNPPPQEEIPGLAY